MSHPSLGAPPPDQSAGHPDAAARLRAERGRIAIRALEIALERDPTIRERLGELGLRKLLRDTGVLIDRLALAVATGDPGSLREFAEWVSPVYRRRRVPLDDVVHLCEGLRQASSSALAPDEREGADLALDEAIAVLRSNRRLAGDARRRNPIAQFLYKGA